MAMEEALRARLRAQLACPIDWGWSPQGAVMPRVVLTLVSDLPAYDLDGPSNISHARVQIDCYAVAQADAIVLGRHVATALSGYAATPLLGVFLDGGMDLPPDITAGDIAARRMLTAMVHHRLT